jgi:diguanylate cyclase (GGDEF)-like protein
MQVIDEQGTALIARALRGEELPDRFDIRFRHANGSINIAETRTSAVQGGLQGVSRDVTELRRLQEDMATLALRDPLTGLANRRLFGELLDADLARTQRDGLPLAVAFLDLDGLKNVNDIYGHNAGDHVLRETARRLRKVLRGADTVARIGGDEFVIAYAPNDANSFNLIPRIDRALAEPIAISDAISVLCPASIGVADTSKVGYASAALLAAADKAMYDTKRARQVIRDADLARA